MTSFGLFSSLLSYCEASTSRPPPVPSGSIRTTELVTCSQTIRRPSASSVIPLPLLLGFATSVTPLCSSQRRRVSPGMSLKRRKFPRGFQIGPSVKVKPVPIRSTSAFTSTSSWSWSDSARTLTRRSFRAPAGRTYHGRLDARASVERFGVDALLAVAESPAGAGCTQRDDLTENRQGGLGLRVGAEVEAARAGDPLQLRLVYARFE